MSKILISWLDIRLDFTTKDGLIANRHGPNFHIHQFYFEKEQYDKHILLSWKTHTGGKAQADAFEKLVRECFDGRSLEFKFVGIDDPLDLPMIKAESEKILLGNKNAQLDIFFNPGFQMMQLAWFLCHTSLGLNTRLLQLRQGLYTQSGLPALEEIKLEQSPQAYSLLISQQGLAGTSPIIGGDKLVTPSLERVYEKARHVAGAAGCPVLVMGDSGTGKELLAAYIQENDPSSKSFYKVNCAAFSDELLRSELFGHAKGAFTGATAEKLGFFEKADGGTLFLDEIGDVSPFMQQALLRVLQEGEFQRVGETETRHTNVRVIAATNKRLLKEVKQGKFRLDLYYRLAVARLYLPNWGDLEKAEKEKALDYMLEKAKDKVGSRRKIKLSKEAQAFLLSFDFQGNFRQLENFCQSLYVFYGHLGELDIHLLKNELAEEIALFKESDSAGGSLKWQEVEKAHIAKVLRMKDWNITHTSEAVGYAVNTLKKKIKEYGL